MFYQRSVVPLAPNLVQVVSESRSLSITWTAPENVDSIIDYEVTYSSLMTPNDSTVIRVIGGALSAVAGGLNAFTEYSVAVRGCSQVSCGPFSSTIIQSTFEEGKSLICMQLCMS